MKMDYPYEYDPIDKMFRFLTGKGVNQRSRKEKAIKFPVKVRVICENASPRRRGEDVSLLVVLAYPLFLIPRLFGRS